MTEVEDYEVTMQRLLSEHPPPVILETVDMLSSLPLYADVAVLAVLFYLACEAGIWTIKHFPNQRRT